MVFVDRTSMDAAYKAVKRVRKGGRDLVWEAASDEVLPALGSSSNYCPASLTRILLMFVGYLNHHRLRYPEKSELLQSVNKFMTVFAEREATQAKIQARRRQVPDAEGFVTVSRGGRTGPAKQEAAQELARKQRDKQQGLTDFYRFQMRERQKAKAGELVRRFEEDKQMVKRMREQRSDFMVRLTPEPTTLHCS